MDDGKNIAQSVIYIILSILIVVGLAFTGYGIYKKITRDIPNPVATIEIENYGTIKVELYPDEAPNTVINFICLANRGYYTDKVFYRTIPDFMIQGGGTADGSETATLADIMDDGEDEEYCIEGEFLANGYNDNKIQFERGVIGMARNTGYSSISTSLVKEDYNSASSQFFIMQADKSSQMNGLYAPFGKVIEGMEIVDEIANVEVVTRDEDAEEGVDKPVDPPVIKSITVETYGVDYGTPTTVEPFDYYTWLMQYYGYSY